MRSISCGTLDIALADVMAFGDNYNDVSMLEPVGVPYLWMVPPHRCGKSTRMDTPVAQRMWREFLKQPGIFCATFEMIRYKLHSFAGRTALTGEFL